MAHPGVGLVFQEGSCFRMAQQRGRARVHVSRQLLTITSQYVDQN